MLSKKEKEAIKALEECGWQIIRGAHLEDWDEDQSIKGPSFGKCLEIRADISIIKVDI